ncbi:GNAT family N-acetyltransferase [uncultured Shewanella sp.]|uniref:GNAT family N-acetyltransferase n=1 Tax=uncultured Shewanella sp. TaxID=173975 RepID=UPI00261A8882|nr:GNAT family N-acetyltransferase [uncultured Shewanella sp.]
MIELIASCVEDIPYFVSMEQNAETIEYIIPYSHEKHISEMLKDEIVYLSILESQVFVGFIILANDASSSVEFRRIVIGANGRGRGLGQLAIQKMELYCQSELKAHRIWLDVFDTNLRGQYLYQKLGYQQFDQQNIDGQLLFYFEKKLACTVN